MSCFSKRNYRKAIDLTKVFDHIQVEDIVTKCEFYATCTSILDSPCISIDDIRNLKSSFPDCFEIIEGGYKGERCPNNRLEQDAYGGYFLSYKSGVFCYGGQPEQERETSRYTVL